MLAWLVCALWVVVLVKHADHKEVLSVFGGGVVSTLMLLPLALQEPIDTMRASWRPLLAIALLAACERNLTNESLGSIGASLKTALHAFNVPITFVVAAALGVDRQAQRWLFRGECTPEGWALVGVLSLVAAGALVTAFCAGHGRREGAPVWSGSGLGISLQLGSGVAYAAKYAVAKRVLGDAAHSKPCWLDDAAPLKGKTPPFYSALQAADNLGDLEDGEQDLASCSGEVLRPSKVQIAVVAQPMTGLVSLLFLPFSDKGWGSPSLGAILGFALGVTGILVFELRVLELTSPLTVAMLSSMNNVVIVLYFVLWDGEEFSLLQQVGFAISTVGIIGYAHLKHRQQEQPRLHSRSRQD